MKMGVARGGSGTPVWKMTKVLSKLEIGK